MRVERAKRKGRRESRGGSGCIYRLSVYIVASLLSYSDIKLSSMPRQSFNQEWHSQHDILLITFAFFL